MIRSIISLTVAFAVLLCVVFTMGVAAKLSWIAALAGWGML